MLDSYKRPLRSILYLRLAVGRDPIPAPLDVVPAPPGGVSKATVRAVENGF